MILYMKFVTFHLQYEWKTLKLLETFDSLTLKLYLALVLKQILILAFKSSLSSQTNSLNILLNIRSSKITVLLVKCY